MGIVAGLRTGIRLAGKIDRKYNLNKIFIQKYVPPGYRKTANKLVDIAGIVGGGYGIYNALIAPDTPGNSATIPFQKQPKTYKPYQTRGRLTTGYRSKYSRERQLDKKCRRAGFSKY